MGRRNRPKHWPAGWRLTAFSRNCMERRGQWAEQDVNQIMQWGYLVEDCSPYHVKISATNEPEVDFWPTSLKWRDPKGFKFEAHGVGLESLKAYLEECHPLPEDRKP